MTIHTLKLLETGGYSAAIAALRQENLRLEANGVASDDPLRIAIAEEGGEVERWRAANRSAIQPAWWTIMCQRDSRMSR